MCNSDEKELNRKSQQAQNKRANSGSDEEFAEKMYDDDAPKPPQFEDEHDVSTTGGDLTEERKEQV